MTVLLGRFLVVGFLAWIVSIVLGTGAYFGLWSWRRHWPLAGALAGVGTFALYVGTNSMTASVMPLFGGLFVGCGIALTYGTLFQRTSLMRPTLREGSAEEHLWLRDAVDRLRPQALDWIITAGLLLPGAALVWLSPRRLFDLGPAVIGAVSWLGPLYAGIGLALRHRASTRILAQLEEREGLGEASAAQRAGDMGISRSSAPSSSRPEPTRRD